MLTGQSGNDAQTFVRFFFLPLSESLLMMCLILTSQHMGLRASLSLDFITSFKAVPWMETSLDRVVYWATNALKFDNDFWILVMWK